jgi:hypothetical protein
MWSLRACDIRGAKKMVAQWNQGHVHHVWAHHWPVYEVDGRRLSLSPRVVCTIT